MNRNVGYPLPDGELGEDEIVCQLVYLPDRPEYWQAFLGALHYMTTWRAWEKDSDKRGKDAASNWREAFELTIGCWRMTCLEELQDNVAEILAIMQLGNSCCDEQDITDGDQYTDRVEDGVGDVPQNIIDAGYATGVSDWAGFDDYKCMISHVTVNQLTARLDELALLVNQYGAVAGGAAAVAAILAVVFGTGGLAIVFGMIAGVGAVSLLYEALMDFPSLENLSTKVTTNHEELACAIYDADGDEGALIALNDKIDELFTVVEAVILKNMNMGPTLKSLYAGRYDQQDVAEILEAAGYDVGDFDCECDLPIGEFYEVYDFDSTINPWVNGGVLYGAYGRGSTNGVRMMYNSSGYMKQTTSTLLGEAGISPAVGDKVWINKIKLWYQCINTNWPGTYPQLTILHDGGDENENLPFVADSVWTEVIRTFDPPLLSTHFGDNVYKINVTNGGGGGIAIDDITIDYDAEDV